MDSVFPQEKWSFDREVVKWEDYLFELTPVEEYEMSYKREDYFAPLGYGNVNGSKMRQCLWLVDQFIKERNAKGIVSGSVVGSPQHPMIASICKHYGIGCLIVAGTQKIEDHEYLVMAQQWGAHFHNVRVGYSKALQSIAFKLNKRLYKHEVLETNITVDERLNSSQRVRDFHAIGAYQVKNIPDHIETIIMPCGSCNSVTSVLYGIFKYRPKNLKKILFMGIGNNGSYNLPYIPNRLAIIEKVDKTEINKLYKYKFLGEEEGEIECEHHDLNGTGFCNYGDLMPFQIGDIEFHPRYEGKVMNYMKENNEIFGKYINKNTLFWIIGGVPRS